jgi:hypothetical protein
LPDTEQANAFSDCTQRSLHVLERVSSLFDVSAQLARALETSTLDGRLEDYVELVTACADMARHRVDSLGENGALSCARIYSERRLKRGLHRRKPDRPHRYSQQIDRKAESLDERCWRPSFSTGEISHTCCT